MLYFSALFDLPNVFTLDGATQKLVKQKFLKQNPYAKFP